MIRVNSLRGVNSPLLVLLVVPLCLLWESCMKEPASIVVHEASHDFGRVIQGDSARHAFEIRNAGGTPLHIEKVKTSCGCVAVSFDETIRPGGTGVVELELKTNRERGRIEKTATIVPSDRTLGDKALVLSGEVVPFAVSEPETLELESFPSEVLRGTVMVRPATGMSLELVSAKLESDVLSVETEYQESQEGCLEKRVRVTIGGVARDTPGVLNEGLILKIKTSDGVKRELLVPVRVRILDDVCISTKNLVFGRRDTQRFVSDGVQVEKSVFLSAARQDMQFKVQSVQLHGFSGGVLEQEVTTLEQGVKYEIKIRLKRIPPERLSRGRLVVCTDEATQGRKEVRVMVLRGET